MRDDLERLLRAADVPDPERAELLWQEYRAAGPWADGAFATLLAWYGYALYRRVWGFVRADVAEDIFQDVLAALHRHRRDPRLARFADALPWLRTVADNACREHARRGARRKRREEGRAAPEPDDTHPGGRAELREELIAALGKLSPAHRQAVALVFFEGMGRQAAATVMGVNRDTLAKRLGEALDRLRVLIPAPEVLVAVGTAGVEGALTAAIPQVSAARLTELAGRAAAKAAATGPAVGKLAAVVLLGLSVGGAALAGWAMTRAEDLPPPADQAPVTQLATVHPPESVPDRNRRLFTTEVLSRQLLALRPLVVGGGPVALEALDVHDARVLVTYQLRHRIEGEAGSTSHLYLIHNPAECWTGIQFWSSRGCPLTGEEVEKSTAVSSALAAFDRLPHDGLATGEWREHVGRQERAISSYLGIWFINGELETPARLSLSDSGGWVMPTARAPTSRVWVSGKPASSQRVLYRELHTRRLPTVLLDSLKFDPDHRRVRGLMGPISAASATLSADGQWLEFENGEKWSRQPIRNPPPYSLRGRTGVHCVYAGKL